MPLPSRFSLLLLPFPPPPPLSQACPLATEPREMSHCPQRHSLGRCQAQRDLVFSCAGTGNAFGHLGCSPGSSPDFLHDFGPSVPRSSSSLSVKRPDDPAAQGASTRPASGEKSNKYLQIHPQGAETADATKPDPMRAWTRRGACFPPASHPQPDRTGPTSSLPSRPETEYPLAL